jgi:TRAP-type uncharacterized transport system substrate-binding protein
MLGGIGRRLLKACSVIILALGLGSIALSYFFPEPPSKVTIATAFPGASFDFYGQRYREKFARENVKVELRQTAGALENLQLLKDPNSGIQIAFVTGGVSNSLESPELLSLGVIDYLPIWIFYDSALSLDSLSQLKGKRISVGPTGSGTRYTAEQVLGKAGVRAETATFLPQAGTEAARALIEGKTDVAWILGAPEAPSVHSLLKNPNVGLMDFPMAEALTRIFPSMVRLVLPRGVIDLERQIPPLDVTLIATTNRVLVRSELHPAIVALLLQTMVSVHGKPNIFARPGEFPKPTDPDYPVAASAVDFYKNGPSFLERHLPLWLTVHAQRAIAALVTGLAIGFPLVRYFPLLYRWNMRRRLLHWYALLKSLEESLEQNLTEKEMMLKQSEVDRIEDAVSHIRFPLALTDQLYDLRGHIEIVRRRLASRTARMAPESDLHHNRRGYRYW